MLTYLTMFGWGHAADFCQDAEGKQRVEALQASLAKSNYSSNKTTYLL